MPSFLSVRRSLLAATLFFASSFDLSHLLSFSSPLFVEAQLNLAVNALTPVPGLFFTRSSGLTPAASEAGLVGLPNGAAYYIGGIQPEGVPPTVQPNTIIASVTMTINNGVTWIPPANTNPIAVAPALAGATGTIATFNARAGHVAIAATVPATNFGVANGGTVPAIVVVGGRGPITAAQAGGATGVNVGTNPTVIFGDTFTSQDGVNWIQFNPDTTAVGANTGTTTPNGNPISTTTGAPVTQATNAAGVSYTATVGGVPQGAIMITGGLVPSVNRCTQTPPGTATTACTVSGITAAQTQTSNQILVSINGGAQWTVNNNAPWPKRYGHAMAAVTSQITPFGQLIFLTGGMDPTNAAIFTDTWKFDVNAQTWQQVSAGTGTVTQNWSARAFHSSIGMNGILYVMGGLAINMAGTATAAATAATTAAGAAAAVNPALAPVQDIWSSPDGTTWFLQTTAGTFTPRGYAAMGSVGTDILMVGGANGQVANGLVGAPAFAAAGVGAQPANTAYDFPTQPDMNIFRVGGAFFFVLVAGVPGSLVGMIIISALKKSMTLTEKKA